MQTGYFEKQIVLTPDLCGSAAALSPLAAFTIFQGVADRPQPGGFLRTGVSQGRADGPDMAGTVWEPGHPVLPQLPADEGRTDRRAGPDAVGHPRPGKQDPAL